MGEFISRLFLNAILMVVVIPLACLVATPFILVLSIFESEPTWKSVRQKYQKLIQRFFEFGITV